MKAIPGKLAFLAAIFFLTSCSTYYKIRKSNDHEMKLNKAFEYYEKGSYTKTIQLLGDIVDVYKGTAREDSILFIFGSANYMQTDFLFAQEIFGEYRRSFARSPLIEQAEYMYTMSFYYRSPKPYRDQTATIDAMLAIEEFVNRYPDSEAAADFKKKYAELQQKLYDKALLNARVYYDIGYYNSAVTALRNAIDEYPESNHNEELNYLIVSAWHKFAKHSIEAKQRERYMSMQDAYFSFIADYPDSAYRKELEQMNEEAVKYLARFKEDNTQSN